MLCSRSRHGPRVHLRNCVSLGQFQQPESIYWDPGNKNRLFIAVDLLRMKALIFEMMGLWHCGWWLQILNINRFKKQSYENDEVKVSIFNVKGSFLPWVMYVYDLLLKLPPLSVVVSSFIFKPPRFPFIYCLLVTFFYMSLQVSLTLDITADLQWLFTWNTKQV